MTNRFLNEERLVKRIEAEFGSVGGRFQKWLRRQPKAPRLLSRKAAAEVLGVPSSNIQRFQAQGRMPFPIEVEGAAPVYVADEVEDLAKEVQAERAEREAKKEKK